MRAICLALPEVTERPSHGAPTWFVQGRPGLWSAASSRCSAWPGLANTVAAGAPDRFFRPPYVGDRGWIGVRLDRDPDWTEIAELCRDAYRAVAPARLVALLD